MILKKSSYYRKRSTVQQNHLKYDKKLQFLQQYMI